MRFVDHDEVDVIPADGGQEIGSRQTLRRGQYELGLKVQDAWL